MNKLYTIEYAICEQCQDIRTPANKMTLEELGPRPLVPLSVLANKWNKRRREIKHELFEEHKQLCFTFCSEEGRTGSLCDDCLARALQEIDEWEEE